ncbi:MAG: endonuclease/exonuclease/phosphatase family protein [Acidobacteriota bacterium]
MHITVMSYNIMTGAYGPYGLEGVARIIDAHKPDIVGLQEVNSGRRPIDWLNQTKWLGERLSMHYAFGPAEKNVMYHEKIREYGNALLSRFPIVRPEVRLLPTLYDEPNINMRQPRAILATILDLGDFYLNIFVTHWGLTVEQRLLQARETIEIVKGWQPNNPAILLGDLNALPGTQEIAMLNNTLGDALVSIPVEQRYTYPSGPFGSRTPNGWFGAIDYIYAVRGSTPLQAQVIYDDSLASDHNPVIAKLDVQAVAQPISSQVSVASKS